MAWCVPHGVRVPHVIFKKIAVSKCVRTHHHAKPSRVGTTRKRCQRYRRVSSAVPSNTRLVRRIARRAWMHHDDATRALHRVCAHPHGLRRHPQHVHEVIQLGVRRQVRGDTLLRGPHMKVHSVIVMQVVLDLIPLSPRCPCTTRAGNVVLVVEALSPKLNLLLVWTRARGRVRGERGVTARRQRFRIR